MTYQLSMLKRDRKTPTWMESKDLDTSCTVIEEQSTEGCFWNAHPTYATNYSLHINY